MTPSPGRPRSPAIDAAVSGAVHELLEAHGYPALSIERVALAAGVGKAAIYRRWASKAEMVFALVIHDEAITPPVDQGSLAGDLRTVAARIVALLTAAGARRALPGLLADLLADPALTTRFHASFSQAERAVVTVVLDRALARGELARRPDPAAVHAHLLGTAFAWVFLLADELPDDLPDRLATAVCASLRPGDQTARPASPAPAHIPHPTR